MIEEWRPVTYYEGLYEVSNAGRVKSLSRVDHGGNRRREKILKPGLSKDLKVSLCRESGVKQKSVAQLVLESFRGPGNGLWALHRDDDATNNSLDNLYWGTPSDNQMDRVKNFGIPPQDNRFGRDPRTIPPHCANGHLYTEETTYISSTGRQCRLCQREAGRRRTARLRAKAAAKEKDVLAPQIGEEVD
jgi:hypothetical protein